MCDSPNSNAPLLGGVVVQQRESYMAHHFIVYGLCANEKKYQKIPPLWRGFINFALLGYPMLNGNPVDEPPNCR